MGSRFAAAVVGMLLLMTAALRADTIATFVVTPKDIDHVDRSDDGTRVDVVLLPTKAHELEGFTAHHVGKIVIFEWRKGNPEPDQDVSQLVREPITDGVIHFKSEGRLIQPHAPPSMPA